MGRHYIYALFQTLALCRYGLLGYAPWSTLLYSVNVDGDTGGYPHDFTVAATSGDGTATNTYMKWGAYTDKWSEYEDDGSGNLTKKWYSGTSYCVPRSGRTLVSVETRHVKAATAVVRLRVHFIQQKGTNPDNLAENSVTAWQKDVWLPVAMTAVGSGVFVLDTTGTFDSKDSLLSIVSACGWEPPTIPGGELSFEEEVTVGIKYVYIIGEWDGHTSLDA